MDEPRPTRTTRASGPGCIAILVSLIAVVFLTGLLIRAVIWAANP